MAWYDALDPNTAGGMQLGGLFGGLGALGAGLMQAGQMRPLGQPGPTLADAFAGFGQGRQQGIMSAYQNSAIQRQQARQALFQEAQSDKADDAISPQALEIRRGLSSLPQEARAFVDYENAPGLVLDRAKGRTRPMTAEELQAGGYRPGSVVYTNDWTGSPQVVQQPDTLSPDAEAQRLRLTVAGRAPRETWSDITDESGAVVGQRSSTGQRVALPEKPLSPGQAMSDIAMLGPGVASGQYQPGSPQFNRYAAAYTVATQPKTEFVADPRNPGTLIPAQRPGMNIPPQFPNPTAMLGGGLPQPAPAAAAQPAAQPAPADGVPIPGTTMTATPPPAGATPRVTPAQATLLQKGEEEGRKLQDAVDNYMAVLRRHGTGLSALFNNPTDPKAQEVLGAYERVKMAMRSEGLLNTGVLQPGEAVMLNDMLLDPKTFRGALATPEAVQARLNQFSKQALDFYNTRREQAGLPRLETLSRNAPVATGTPTMRWNPQTRRAEPVR